MPWLLKTEPSTYSWQHLREERRTAWNGVKNPVAVRHMSTMRSGELAYIYHTGDEKAVVGIARILGKAYPDPTADDPKLLAVDVAPVEALARPVTLAEIKEDARFSDSPLVRVPRLSVVPLDDRQWRAILELAGVSPKKNR